jgi:hypothetical protein
MLSCRINQAKKIMLRHTLAFPQPLRGKVILDMLEIQLVDHVWNIIPRGRVYDFPYVCSLLINRETI